MQEQTPLMIAPHKGTRSIPMLGVLCESCRSANYRNQSERTKEATLVPTGIGSSTLGYRVRDHVLLRVTAVIQWYAIAYIGGQQSV